MPLAWLHTCTESKPCVQLSILQYRCRYLVSTLRKPSVTLLASPLSCHTESLSTLKYANRARNIRNQPLAQRVADTDAAALAGNPCDEPAKSEAL
jgi:hypothetical protein